MWGGLGATKDFFIESGDECFVTDITNELSAGLENPTLLAESVSLFDNHSNFDYGGSPVSSPYNCDFINEFVKDESIDFDIDNDGTSLIKNELSSGNGSGSETSSLEQNWNVKSEIDTPPTTPPDARVSPESVCIITSSDLKFFPVAAAGATSSRSRCKPRLKTIASKEIRAIPDLLSPKVLHPASCVILGDDEISRGAEMRKFPICKEEQQKQQAKRRQERMIRNRESAYLSRKRKKEHVTLLEKQVQKLTLENQKLRLENSELCERLQKYEPWHKSKQTWRRLPDLPRKTTALLALVVTVCINIGSLSGVLDSGQLQTQQLQKDPSPSNHHTRSLLWTEPLDDSGLSNLTTSCPVAINQSESIRLERELRRWIVGEKDLWQRAKTAETVPVKPSVSSRKKRLPRMRKPSLMANGIDVFNIKPQLLGMESLYEAIHRRADTFYLVSFSADHLLLPAISRNQTSRPKISVMLPAVLANSSNGGSEHVEMMQIDCEVTNTQLLSVRGDDIPSHMRNIPKYSNASVKAVADPNTFQPYEISEHPENFLINLHKRASIQGNKSSARDKSYPAVSKPSAVELPKNLSLPELVSPYINGSLDSPAKNGTLVTKSAASVNITERHFTDFENGYKDTQLFLRGDPSSPPFIRHESNTSESGKPDKYENNYLKRFTRG